MSRHDRFRAPVRGVSTPGDAERSADPEPVGRYLSRQRRLRGISLPELADLTRIPLRSLERLEDGRFDGTADGFTRGFVRTVALALGLDPDDTVARMLAEVEISDGGRTGVDPTPVLRGLVAVGAILVLAAMLGMGRAVWRWASANPSTAGDRVYWQDPVRALAESEAALAPTPWSDHPPGSGVPDAPVETSATARAH